MAFPKKKKKTGMTGGKTATGTKLPIRAQLRAYGLPEPVVVGWNAYRRYTNLEKAVYWWYFAALRKLQDFRKYGRCISCNKPLSLEDSQAGHFEPAGNCGFALLFHPMNVNAECAGCNGFDSGHLIGYGINLEKRYGKGTVHKLHQMKYRTTKEWSRLEYVAKIWKIIAEYKKILESL